MKILVLNSGSSSIKYQLLNLGTDLVLASGLVEKIGESAGRHTHRGLDAAGQFDETVRRGPISNHGEGLRRVVGVLGASGQLRALSELDGIGHRVVHGGETFPSATRIDAKVVRAIRALIPLAPLHNAANLLGIEVALELCPKVPQVAVFDTAFHRSMPAHVYRYALPRKFYSRHRVRRYGFHGTSHRYVAGESARVLQRPLRSLNLITLHLGNGASATAIRAGRSSDTSMGMTPLEGLMMGTRSGDLDPAIPFYLGRTTGYSADRLETLLNHESGLKGICGVNDMREVLRRAEAGDSEAALAIKMYCYRIKKYIGAYLAVLGRVDAVVFTGGIGENNPLIRQQVCAGLEKLGLRLDARKNRFHSDHAREIQSPRSAVKILVVPTNEELEIARQTAACVRSSLRRLGSGRQLARKQPTTQRRR
jgi:acetate kinase